MLAKVYLIAHAVCVQYAAGKPYLEYDAVGAVKIIVPVVNPFGEYRAQSVGNVRVLRRPNQPMLSPTPCALNHSPDTAQLGLSASWAILLDFACVIT